MSNCAQCTGRLCPTGEQCHRIGRYNHHGDAYCGNHCPRGSRNRSNLIENVVVGGLTGGLLGGVLGGNPAVGAALGGLAGGVTEQPLLGGALGGLLASR